MATAAHPNQAAADDKGRSADKPTDIPAPGWKEILLRTWKEAGNDNIGIVAAGVAFYGFLALVPLLGATVLIYGLVAEPQTVMQHASSLTDMLPTDVAQLISQQLITVVQTSGGKKGLGLAIALAISLWGARNAAGSVVTALNIAYEEEEKRGFIKTNLLAIAMTVGAVLLAIMAGGAIGMLGYLQHLFPGLGPMGAFFWRVLTYLLLGSIAAGAAATLFRYGPSREKATWTWLTPGSLTFAIAWIVLTLAFGFYVSNFGNYGATYGSLSAIVVLLTWLFLSSYVLLFAAELNSEIEHQTERDTTDRPNDKPLGARGAWSADHVAAGTTDPDASKQQDGARAQPQSPAATSSGGSGVLAGAAPAASAAADRDGDGHPFLTSRVTNKAGRLAGTAKVGMIGSALATLGLGFLRRRGKEGTGAALLAAAAGLALLRRK
ncbi:YihY/virulence factor BrkB family protein [uncultured Sphingomonas sp.]|uniref:YihY/virulence factor BrkB family protein n=1 Tax=uncultured Sphingomonas sp. TaxID=158754 RepID=UPI0025EEB711|nr:YihY/virulence factor BrkB family protein [uncultured Sphingomonas sp.]